LKELAKNFKRSDEIVFPETAVYPLLGWYSPTYKLKQTCSVLQTKENGTPEQIVFITAIGIDQQPNIDQLKNIA
jgi:hypothetical protein